MFPLIDHLTGAWPDAVLAVLIGPLVVAGVAKLSTPPEKLAWPIDAALLRAPHGPRLVGLAELAAVLAIVLVPGRAAAIVAGIVYAALAAVASAMVGQRCACFGTARLAAVGRLHVGANAAGAVVAVALALVSPPAADSPVRAGVGAVAGLLTLGVVVALDRRRGEPAEEVPNCDEPVSAVRLYVSENCPSCHSLKQLLATMEPARRAAITTIVVDLKQPAPAEIGDLGVPCAQGLDAAGQPVCAPRSGIGAVKALVDSVTLAAPVGVGGR